MWDGINVTTDKMNYPAWTIYMNRLVFFELQMHSHKKDFYQKWPRVDDDE